MAEETAGGNAKIWMIATAVAALAAIGMAGWGYMESQRATTLQTSLNAESQRASALQTSLDAESQRAASLQSQLDTALADSNNRLSEANAALEQASKRDLPISVSVRPALLGSGLVATFKNHSSQALEVAAMFSSPSTGQQRPAKLVIPPNGLTEIGYAEGWAFAKGNHVTLTNNEFRPLEYVVPGS